MRNYYHAKCSSFIALTYHFFNVIAGHVKAFVLTLQEFKISIALEIGLLTAN